MNKVGHSSW